MAPRDSAVAAVREATRIAKLVRQSQKALDLEEFQAKEKLGRRGPNEPCTQNRIEEKEAEETELKDLLEKTREENQRAKVRLEDLNNVVKDTLTGLDHVQSARQAQEALRSTFSTVDRQSILDQLFQTLYNLRVQDLPEVSQTPFVKKLTEGIISEREEAQRKRDEAKREGTKTQKELEKLKQQFNEMSNDLKNLRQQVANWKRQYEKRGVEIDTVAGQRDGLDNQIKELRTRYKQLKDDDEERKKDQSSLRQQNRDLAKMLSTLREETRNWKTEVDKLKTERESFKSERNILKRKDELDRKNQEIESLRKQLKESEDKCSTSRVSIKNLERKVSELDETVEARNERISGLENHNEELEQGKETDQRTIEKLSERVQQTVQEATSCSEKAQKEKVAAERIQQDLHQKIARLQQHLQSNAQTIQDEANEQQRIARGHAKEVQEQKKQRENSIRRLVTMFSGSGLTQGDVQELFDIDEEVTKAHQLAEKTPKNTKNPKTDLPRLRYLSTRGGDYLYPEPYDEKRVQLIRDTLRLAYTSSPFNLSMAYNMQRLHLSARVDEPVLEKGVVLKVILHRLLRSFSADENINFTNLVVVIQCVIWLHRQNTIYGDKVLQGLWYQLSGFVSRIFTSCSVIVGVMNDLGTSLQNNDPSWSFAPLPFNGGWEDTTKTLSTIDNQWTLMTEGPDHIAMTDYPRTSNSVLFVPKFSLHRVFNPYVSDFEAITLSIEENDDPAHRFHRDQASSWLEKYVPHVLEAKLRDSTVWKEFMEQVAEDKIYFDNRQKELEALREKMDREREKSRKEMREWRTCGQ